MPPTQLVKPYGTYPQALMITDNSIDRFLAQDVIAAAKRKGQGFECDTCHTKDGMAPGTEKRFAELLKLFAAK